MRKLSIFAATAATALLLSACSKKTDDAAGSVAESAASDVAKAADKAVAATDELGAKADELGEKAAAEAKKAAEAAKRETAKVEARLHNESAEDAKAD